MCVVKMKVTCVRFEQKLVGKGMYRCVLRVGNLALKIELSKNKSIRELQKRAVKVDLHQREIREKLDFFPKYYGTIIAGVEQNEKVKPAIVTFHEYIDPISFYSIEVLRKIFNLIGKASKEGYVLDIKPSNFGIKRGQVFYLDEYGVGKGLFPPDVLEDINKFIQFSLNKLKKVVRRVSPQ